VGSERNRIRQMVDAHKMSEADARAFIHEEDIARSRYVKKHFSQEFADPMRYDYTINTDQMHDEAIVRALVSAIQSVA
jgi:cytidylate kinase